MSEVIDQDFKSKVARAAAQLMERQLSYDELVQYAAAMQVGSAMGVAAMEALLHVVRGLDAATNAAETAAQFSTRIGEAIAFAGVPEYARNLVSAGKAIQGAQAAGTSKALGARGGAARSLKTNALKVWAVEQARSMKGDDKSIARLLSERLPVELADASRDPERLIYDAIRVARKGQQLQGKRGHGNRGQG